MAIISPILSASQLETLAELGEERTAAVGEVLYGVGDARYPFIAILEGEAAILDAAGDEIVRHGALRLPRRAQPDDRPDGLSDRHGDAADALHRRRPRRAAAAAVRGRAARRHPALRVHRASRGAAAAPGHRLEIVGPRSSAATRAMVDYVRRARLPHTWRDPEHDDDPATAALVARSRRTSCRSCGCRAAPSCAGRAGERCGARSASAPSSAPARRSTSSSSAAGRPASAPPSTARRRASRR